MAYQYLKEDDKFPTDLQNMVIEYVTPPISYYRVAYSQVLYQLEAILINTFVCSKYACTFIHSWLDMLKYGKDLMDFQDNMLIISWEVDLQQSPQIRFTRVISAPLDLKKYNHPPFTLS